ncbi:MAG: outer membrane protein assembly factor BamD [Candidatus Marinimicrobia bacterium]|nr:outer membrane protein assembly factor BamD [Candidatus Neomarinimicrobiota bacterium]
MKLELHKLIYLVLGVALLVSCAGNRSQTFERGSEYYVNGKKAFDNEKWLKAIDNLKLFILNNPGSQQADSAQYFLAESYYNNKEYLMAISEYRQLKNKYSYSPLVEEGSYKMAKSYVKLSPNYHLDQQNTRRAIRYCQSFISNFPNSKYVEEVEKDIQNMRNKLGHKLFTSGDLYRKMHRWEAAVIYFNEMIDQYYDTEWVIDAKLEKAFCLIKLRRFEEYNNLVASIRDNNKNNKKVKSKLNELRDEYNDELAKIEKEKEKKEGRF